MYALEHLPASTRMNENKYLSYSQQAKCKMFNATHRINGFTVTKGSCFKSETGLSALP